MSRVRSILHAINPIALFFGPIFQKEVRTAGRKRSTYILRTLYCVGLLIILVAAFLNYRSTHNARSAVLHLQSMQTLAPKLTLVVAWFQFGILLFVSPILAAGSICDERRSRSLDVLMTTPMTASQIILGKLTSRIVQLIILAVLATPALLAVRVFGGLSAEVVLATTAIAISTAILGAALAVLFSVRQKRATMAALFGILSLLLLQCGPGVAEGIRYHIANEWVVLSPYRSNILATCAPATLHSLSESVFSGRPLPHVILFEPSKPTAPAAPTVATSPRPIDLGPAWALNTAYNLLLAAGITLYTTIVLRRAMKKAESREGLLAGASVPTRSKRKTKPAVEPEPAPDGTASVPSTVPEPFNNEPGTIRRGGTGPPPAAQLPAHPSRSRDRLVTDNPVLWREVRQPTFGSRTLFRIVAALTITCLAILYWQIGFGEIGLHGALAFVGMAAIIFQAVFLTSGPFAGEREARTWDVLLTTTLSPGQILRGKLLGMLRGFWFIPAIVLIHFIIASVVGNVRPIAILYIALIYTGPALLFTATGSLLSLRFRKAVTAGALNLTLAVTLWGLLWFLPLVLPLILRVVLLIPSQLGLVHSDLVVDSFLDDHFLQVIDGIYALNPIALIDVAVTPCLLESGPRGIANVPFQTQLIQPQKLTMADCTWVVLAVFSFYTLSAIAVLALARFRFKAWSGRSS